MNEEIRELGTTGHDALEGGFRRCGDPVEVVVRATAPQVEVRVGDRMARDALPIEDRLDVGRKARAAVHPRGEDERTCRGDGDGDTADGSDQPSTVRNSETLHCSSTARKTHGPGSASGIVADHRPGALSTL